MSARAADLSVKTQRGCGCKSSGQSGGCGCDGGCGGGCSGTCVTPGECPIQCCELECLVRPNFFCGQLLTDADLAAMVDWTRKRFALSRYKDGWGIVCGLDVTCGSPDDASRSCCDETPAGKGPFVWLTPGYAIDCCGNDLVACCRLKIDLGPICKPPFDPCDPRPQPQPAPDPAGQPDPAAGGAERDPCFAVDRANLFAVQLSLRYHEDFAQGQRAMFRSGGACGDTAACEYARVLEQPCVHLECVPLPIEGDEEPDDVEDWLNELRTRVRQVSAEITVVLRQGPDAVLKYLRAYPPYQSCYLQELVCCLRQRDAQQFAPASMGQLGGLLLLDRLARELPCNCFDCRPDSGVPLGVAILRRSIVDNRTVCTVYKIDPRDRYRRYLKKEICQRLRDGTVNLTQYVGQPLVRVSRQLRDAGVTLDQQVHPAPANVDELADMAGSHVFSIDPAARQALRPQVVVDPLGTPRILGFVPR